MPDAAQALAEILRLTSALVTADGVDQMDPRDLEAAATALRRAVARAGVSAPAEAPRHPRLSPRERQIVRLLARGVSYKEIADELGLAFSTTQSRVKAIYGKLGVHSKRELAKYA